MTLLVIPSSSAYSTFKEQSTLRNIDAKKRGWIEQEKPETMVGKGYLLINAFTYTTDISIPAYEK